MDIGKIPAKPIRCENPDADCGAMISVPPLAIGETVQVQCEECQQEYTVARMSPDEVKTYIVQ